MSLYKTMYLNGPTGPVAVKTTSDNISLRTPSDCSQDVMLATLPPDVYPFPGEISEISDLVSYEYNGSELESITLMESELRSCFFFARSSEN